MNIFNLAITEPLYIDPSVMTYAIQVVAGLIVAVGAVVGVRWRKAKKALQEKLGIDANANKLVEEEVIEFSEEKKEAGGTTTDLISD